MVKLVGIDPGLKGGIAGLDTEAKTLWAIPMPVKPTAAGKSEYDITSIARILSDIRPDRVCIENVHSMPGQGVASTFLFGKGFGILLGILGALDFETVLVTPRTWKSKYSLTSDKEMSRAKATEMYPSCAMAWKLKKNDGIAEAAILAHYLYGDALDGISSWDISGLYPTGAPLPYARPSTTRARRHNDLAAGTKNHRTQRSPRERERHRPNRSRDNRE